MKSRFSTPLSEIYFNKYPSLKAFYNLWIDKAFESKETYNQLIKYLSTNQDETPDTKSSPETHHIQCKFDGGLVKPENEISLHESNHILAHIIRFICQKKPGDFMSALFRICSDDGLAKSEKGKMIASLNKDRGILFWSSEWQKEQGLKRGQKGGLANTVAQFEARSKVGKTYGLIVGLSRQTDKTLETLRQTFLFSHESKPKNIYVFEANYPSLAAIMNVLDSLAFPYKITKRTCFYKVFNGTLTFMYGWTRFNISITKIEKNFADKNIIYLSPNLLFTD